MVLFTSLESLSCSEDVRRYRLAPDRKRPAYGPREATAFSATFVSMQLLPFNQCTVVLFFFPVQYEENLTISFRLVSKKCCRSDGDGQGYLSPGKRPTVTPRNQESV